MTDRVAPGTAPALNRSRGPLDRILSIFTDVQGGEGATALLLMLNVFLLLTSYYILKTLREPLILAGGGAEVKSYAAAGQAILLVMLVPAYSAFASRVDRIKLLTWVTLFFALNLVAFWALGVAKTPYIGVAFFIWVGIFSLMIIAQFWSFANDLYTPEQGRRLFAIVAFGSSLGAIVGAWITKPLIAGLGVYVPMLVAAGILTVSILLFRIVSAREKAARASRGHAAVEEAPLEKKGAFRLIFSDRYLLLIALLMLVYNFVNTNGEYILGKTLTNIAQHAVAAGQTGGLDPKAYEEKFIGLFYSGYFTWVNIISAVVQLLLVGRIMQWFGVRVALFVLPLVALGGYGLLAVTPILAIIRGVKIAENSIDYSLQNTARQALFLPTSREAKYKAKAAIDSFFVRFGDVLSAGLVFLGTKLAMEPRQFALVNLVLVLIWIVIVIGIARRHRTLEAEAGTEKVAA
jgi:ATP:ADP antiporter, AAA family